MLAQNGQHTEARRLLEQIVEADPRQEMAWMWLASVATSRADRVTFLERALALNPANATAQNAYIQLTGQAFAAPAAQPVMPDSSRGLLRAGAIVVTMLVLLITAAFVLAGSLSGMITAVRVPYRRCARSGISPPARPMPSPPSRGRRSPRAHPAHHQPRSGRHHPQPGHRRQPDRRFPPGRPLPALRRCRPRKAFWDHGRCLRRPPISRPATRDRRPWNTCRRRLLSRPPAPMTIQRSDFCRATLGLTNFGRAKACSTGSPMNSGNKLHAA